MKRALCVLALALAGCNRCGPFGGDPKFRSYPAESYRFEKAPAGVSASPDGRWLASSTGEEVLLLETANLGQTLKLQGAQRSPHAFHFTTDGRLLVTAHVPHWDLDCEGIVWDVAARSIRAKRVFSGGVSAVAVSSDGLVACGPDYSMLPSASRGYPPGFANAQQRIMRRGRKPEVSSRIVRIWFDRVYFT